MSAAISARTAPNAKTSGFCHKQKKEQVEQEQMSASHLSPLMSELEVIKKERKKQGQAWLHQVIVSCTL